MLHKILCSSAAVLAVAAATLVAATDRMPVADVRPGMVGTGYTVFEGDRPEPFRVHVIGVLQNVQGPRRSLILARLEGGPLATSGVIAGMSGSPVYIDGRLVGAVAYSLGAFSREPIAGITPIDEMLDIAALPDRPARAAGSPIPVGSGPEGLMASLKAALPSNLPFADRAADVRTVAGSGFDALVPNLRPIATPIALSGFSAEGRAVIARALEGAGFVPVAGGTLGQATETGQQPLRPGDAVGVNLISGDLALAATGTVTLVDGDRVFAFGHPFLNLGSTALPMTRSYVHTVLPSLMSSVKVSSVGSVVGTVRQDRSTAISGTLGAPPPTVPVRIALESTRGPLRQFAFEVANEQTFTPLLVYASILSVLQSYEQDFGGATYSVTGETRVRGFGTVSLDNIFAGEAASSNAAASIALPITQLLRNEVADVEIEAVALTIRASEHLKTATLERAWIDAGEIRPGETVQLKVVTRGYRGDESLRTLPMTIPEHARGTLSLLVADSARLAQWDQREARQPLATESIPQLIRQLNDTRKNNRLYVRLVASEPGAVLNGETLPSLPPSVLTVLEGDKTGGRFAALRTATIGEWELATDAAVAGSRLLTLNVQTR